MNSPAGQPAFISAAKFDTLDLRAALVQSGAGAVVVFEGVVRDHHAGRAVVGLEYSAFEPLAQSGWLQLCDRATREHEISRVVGRHRVGALEIGDCAVWVGVAAAHRSAAFAACEWLIAAIKAELPVWKFERYADGPGAWRHEASPGGPAAAPTMQV